MSVSITCPKVPLPVEDPGPRLTWFRCAHESTPQRESGSVVCPFCTAHAREQPTHTDRPRYMCSNRPHRTQCIAMRPKVRKTRRSRHCAGIEIAKSRDVRDVIKAPYRFSRRTEKATRSRERKRLTSVPTTNSPRARVEPTDTCRCGWLVIGSFVYDLISFDSAATMPAAC